MEDYMPNARDILSSCRVKIIIGIISKTLTHRFDGEFCFGFSDDTHIRAAAKLAKLERMAYPLLRDATSFANSNASR